MTSVEKQYSGEDITALGMAVASSEQGCRPSNASPGINPFLDIEMPVSVSFGRAQVAIRDAIQLAAGSLVPLDRQVDDPVDVLVNGSLVARGEIVQVNGNYGVRVTEMVGRRQAPASKEES